MGKVKIHREQEAIDVVDMLMAAVTWHAGIAEIEKICDDYDREHGDGKYIAGLKDAGMYRPLNNAG